MSEAAVVLLIKKVASLLADEALKRGCTLLCHEASLLGVVRGGLKTINRDLAMMRGFLHDADRWAWEEGTGDSAFKAWVNDVRMAAFEAEDIIDEVLYLLGERRRGGFKGFLHKAVDVSPWLHVAHELQSFESRLNQLSKRRGIFPDMKNGSSPRDQDKIRELVAEKSRSMQEDDVVGIENNKTTPISWLLDGHDEPHLRLSLVWGMGGVGKTTLVGQVYKSHEVMKQFNHRAWISVSQTYQGDDLLRSIFKQLTTVDDEEDEMVASTIRAMTYPQLAQKIRNFLQAKRYLVILDDVWDADVWETVSLALVDNGCGSRIIFTSRIRHVVLTVEETYRMELRPLQGEDAWALFCKKAFGSWRGSSCPPELKNCATRILDKCEGLPLAIVSVGGMLSLRHQSMQAWETFYRGLSWELVHNRQLQKVKIILSLSFKELPYYLRNCLLYCTVFPEDAPIKRKKLILLWVGEGLVEQRGQRTMEEVAEDNINELVHRCMLQVVERNFSGRVKKCRVHDILRELLLSISQAEKFSMIYDSTRNTRFDGKSGMEDAPRRLSIHAKPDDDEIRSWHGKPMSGFRSLLVYGNAINAELITSLLPSGWKLLTVLDLEGAPMESVPREMFKLFNLRYLSLRKTKVTSLSNAVKRLVNLEILDLRDTQVAKLPRGVTRLRRLRHLFVLHRFFSSEKITYQAEYIPCPRGIWNLSGLHTLDGVQADDEMVLRIGNLTRLVSFTITHVKHAHCRYLCEALIKMNMLDKLTVYASELEEEGGVLLELGGLSHPPPLLSKLELSGRLQGGALPTWVGMSNLADLILIGCQLREDPLLSLHALPHLVLLVLAGDAYVGRRLCFRDGWFLKLRRLCIHSLSQIGAVEIEKGAMPSLSHLFLINCPELKQIPQGIQHLTGLQRLQMTMMPHDFFKNLEMEADKVRHVPHVSNLFIGDDGEWHVADPRQKGPPILFYFP